MVATPGFCIDGLGDRVRTLGQVTGRPFFTLCRVLLPPPLPVPGAGVVLFACSKTALHSFVLFPRKVAYTL